MGFLLEPSCAGLGNGVIQAKTVPTFFYVAIFSFCAPLGCYSFLIVLHYYLELFSLVVSCKIVVFVWTQELGPFSLP